MKRTILAAFFGSFITLMMAGWGHAPIEPARVEAQATSTIANWVSNERTSANQLIAWAQYQLLLDAEYRAGGYSTLITANINGSNVGLTQADVTTAEGNLTALANGVMAPPGTSFPISISTGTNTTIFKIK